MAINWQEEFAKANQAYQQAVSAAAQPLDHAAYYNQAYAGLANTYNEAQSYYNTAKQNEINALNAQRDASMKQYGAQLQSGQRQNYVTSMMTEKANPQLLASLGLTGGAAEKLRAKQARDYADSRMATQAQYSQNVSDLMNAHTQSAAEIESNYAKQQMELQRQRQAEAREEARYLYNTAEDARRYAIDSAFRDYELATGNTQWQAGYDLSRQQYQTGVDQWNQQFQQSNAQWQAEQARSQDQFNQQMALQREQFDWQKRYGR